MNRLTRVLVSTDMRLKTCASHKQFHKAVRDVELSEVISTSGCLFCSYIMTDIKYTIDEYRQEICHG